MLQLDLCDYSDVYIFVKEQNNNEYDKKLTFKDDVPFTSCITKTNNTLIENVKNLDVVTLMYNFIEYNQDYSKTSGNL